MEENKEPQKKGWFKFLGGRKSAHVILWLGLPEWFVLIMSYIIKDWEFARFFTSLVLLGILGYLGVNVTQHIKINNNK